MIDRLLIDIDGFIGCLLYIEDYARESILIVPPLLRQTSGTIYGKTKIPAGQVAGHDWYTLHLIQLAPYLHPQISVYEYIEFTEDLITTPKHVQGTRVDVIPVRGEETVCLPLARES